MNISLAHKPAEGSAPVWGYELTTQAATPQGDSADFAAMLNEYLYDLTDWPVPASPLEQLNLNLEQPSGKRFCVGG
jgi:hypothetical protein